MPRVALSGGPYQARSLIAGAQRCVNLYPERNPPEGEAPVPITHYLTPGLRALATAPNIAGYRAAYRATNGELFVVVGSQVYFVDSTWAFTRLGAVADIQSLVSMADNGITVVLVDGSENGYTIDLATHAFGQIFDPAFYGADRVEYLDTFFVFNRPGTGQFYISGSLALTFDPLDIVRKAGGADNIVSIAAVHRELWVIGALSTEIWANYGTPDFTFGQVSGAFIEHGCVAKYSVAKQDMAVFWLSQDQQGQGIVVQGQGYQAKRISTHAIEAAIQSYDNITDAQGYCFQQQGHAFYVLTFPSADHSWAYELATGQWHELASSDANGLLHRHRANACAFAYSENVVGDWQNGKLYALDPEAFTDDGNPIVRIRTFPHLLNDGKRVSYSRFIADIQSGTFDVSQIQGSFSYEFSEGDFDVVEDPQGLPIISLRWSDTRGASWSNPVMQTLGRTGEYLTTVTWNRLGMARDRVFELSWSSPALTALNGAFVEAKPHGS